jgi:hypothetical protein
MPAYILLHSSNCVLYLCVYIIVPHDDTIHIHICICYYGMSMDCTIYYVCIDNSCTNIGGNLYELYNIWCLPIAILNQKRTENLWGSKVVTKVPKTTMKLNNGSQSSHKNLHVQMLWKPISIVVNCQQHMVHCTMALAPLLLVLWCIVQWLWLHSNWASLWFGVVKVKVFGLD